MCGYVCQILNQMEIKLKAEVDMQLQLLNEHAGTDQTALPEFF